MNRVSVHETLQLGAFLQIPRHVGCALAVQSLALALVGFGHSDELQRPDSGRRIKVFLFAGQSNMEGRANGRRLTAEDHRRLQRVQNRIQLAFNHEPIRPLNVVSPSEEIRRIYRRDRIFGPELFFGVVLAEAMPDEKFLFIKLAAGGTSLHGCWNPDWTQEKAALMGEAGEPKLYREFVNYLRHVLKHYSADEYELCSMFWVQGEGDSSVPEAAVNYGMTLQTLIEHIRCDTDSASLPFILFQVGSAQVAKGMRQCSANLANVTLIPQSQRLDSPDFYEKMENGHYNYNGMKKLGTRFAEVFLHTYPSIVADGPGF